MGRLHEPERWVYTCYKWADKAMEARYRTISRERSSSSGRSWLRPKSNGPAGQRSTGPSTHHLDGLRLLTDCGLAYEQGTDNTRRGYNQARFDKLFIDARADDTLAVRVERTDLLWLCHTAARTSLVRTAMLMRTR